MSKTVSGLVSVPVDQYLNGKKETALYFTQNWKFSHFAGDAGAK